MPPRVLRLLGASLLSAVLLAGLSASVAQAQRGGFGFGGFSGRGGFGGGGLLGSLRDESVQSELKLTDDQKAKIQALNDAQRAGFEQQPRVDFRSMSDEERTAYFGKMREQMETRRREADAQLKEILGADQYTRLQQLSLRASGTRGLLGEDVVKDLNLTEDQQAKIREIQDARVDYRSMSDEERTKYREERDAKILAVLTPEQRQKWDTKLGPPPVPKDDAAKPATTTTRSSTTYVPPQATGSTTVAADGSTVPSKVVSSFGGGDTAAKEKDGQAVKSLTFNFRYAPWADVLKLFADASGLTLDLHDVPPGTFSYYDPNQYTPTEALDVLNGYLLPKGYVLIHRNNFLVSLNIDNGIPPNLVPIIRPSELAERGKNELVSVILPLGGLDTDQMAKEVEALLGPQGKAVPLQSSNSLYVQDIASHVRRVNDLLSGLSVPVDDEALTFKSFPLEYIPANDAERQIRSLFGLESATKNVSSSNDSDRYRYYSRDSRDSRSPSPPPPTTPKTKMHVTADMRMNALLITATPTELKLVEQVLKSVDVPQDPARSRVANDTVPLLRVYEVHEADAREVTKTLDAIMPGVVVNEDGRNDFIHIMATPAQHREIEELIRRLDGAGGQSVDVIKLSKFDPVAMTTLLNGMFLKEDKDRSPSIQAEPLTRTIIVRGTTDQIAQVRKTLQAYGEGGTAEGDRIARKGGRFRTVPLGGRDAAEMARRVEGMLSGAKDFRNEIRVVIPSDNRRTPERRVPSASRPLPPTEPREIRHDTTEPIESRDLRTDTARPSGMFISSVSQEDESEAEGNEKTDAAAPSDAADKPAAPQTAASPAEELTAAKPRVNIEVHGDELFLYSPDEQALDRVESLIEDLAQQMPAKTTWTVFYLRSATAQDATSMIEQLMPDSTIGATGDGGLFSSVTSLGSRLADSGGMTSLGDGPQTLRIIPDTRTNAMFVSGPADKVRDVEQFLKILDASEIPESFRDRVPRTIAVKHADVLQVAEMIREVYKDYLEDPRSRMQQQRRDGGSSSNPWASFMGGGGSSPGVGEGIRLTLAVDTRSSELIVSCEESLFREIERLVADRDQAAMQTQPTVRIVTLDEANRAVIQQALSSLSPKILVSTTGSRTTTPAAAPAPSTTSSSSSSSSSGSSDSGDAIRDYFRQRMMERMRDGGSDSGSSRFGSSRWGSGGSSSWGGRSSSGSDRGSSSGRSSGRSR